jgi:transcription initiation factor TFIIIB Brf1 subunit/transcription initiation factor TFIIB
VFLAIAVCECDSFVVTAPYSGRAEQACTAGGVCSSGFFVRGVEKRAFYSQQHTHTHTHTHTHAHSHAHFLLLLYTTGVHHKRARREGEAMSRTFRQRPVIDHIAIVFKDNVVETSDGSGLCVCVCACVCVCVCVCMSV